MLPNKRAVIALKESSVSCPGGDGRFVHYPCADRRVARSLRAIRYAASLGAMPRFASAVVVGLLVGGAVAIGVAVALMAYCAPTTLSGPETSSAATDPSSSTRSTSCLLSLPIKTRP